MGTPTAGTPGVGRRSSPPESCLCWAAREPRVWLLAEVSELRSGAGSLLPGARLPCPLGDAGTRTWAFHCPSWHLSPFCRGRTLGR